MDRNNIRGRRGNYRFGYRCKILHTCYILQREGKLYKLYVKKERLSRLKLFLLLLQRPCKNRFGENSREKEGGLEKIKLSSTSCREWYYIQHNGMLPLYDYVRYLVIVADGKHYLAGPSLEKFDLGPGCMVRLGPIRTSGKVAMLGKLTYRPCVVFQPEEWWLFKDHNDMPLDYVPGKNIVQTRVLDDGVKYMENRNDISREQESILWTCKEVR